MRILIVNKYAYVRGGADRYCATLSSGLRERGHQVAWLALSAEVNQECHGAFVDGTDGSRLLRRAVWNRPAAGAMRALIDDFQPHVVNSHMLYPYLSVSPLIAARRRGVPIVHTLHSYELISADYADPDGGWWDKGGARVKDRILNSVTAPVRRLVHPRQPSQFIAVSKFVAQAHADRGINSITVPNAAQARVTAAPDFSARLGIVFAGRLVEEKGVRDVLDLASRLPDIPITILGAGPLFSLVSERAAHQRNLTAPGWVSGEEVAAQLAGARLLVMPSRCAETSGLAALEAFACSTPVIAFDAGGLSEVIRSSGGGRIVASDPGDLAQACVALHDDQTAWRMASRRAGEASTGVFSPTRWLTAIEAVLASAGRDYPVMVRSRP